jgi:hypothetical protein
MVNKAGLGRTSEVVAIAPRTFAQHVYEHLHPMARANNWQADPMSRCPSYVMWDIPGQGMLLRSFHLHPVAVRVRHDVPSFFSPFQSTLDEEFVARLYRSYPRAYVCTDSDELGVCSLAEVTGESYACRVRRPRSAGVLAEFAEAHAGLMHRELFSHSIRLVTNAVCEENWQAAETEASSIQADVERRLATPDCVLALEVPAAYSARMRRQAMFGHMSPDSVPVRREMNALDHLGAAVRHVPRNIGYAAVTGLHALYITRAARVMLLPMLSTRQRRWCYEFVSGLGIDVPLINSQSRASPTFGLSRLWRWIRHWFRMTPRGSSHT